MKTHPVCMDDSTGVLEVLNLILFSFSPCVPLRYNQHVFFIQRNVTNKNGKFYLIESMAVVFIAKIIYFN
jgi:hypothetical protein